MKTAESIETLRSMRASLKKPLGLVPTMGYLHEGHLSLVRQARMECESVAASIFVNPTQFSPTEDLENYPRDLEMDLGLFEREGVDLVWLPTVEEMYPPDFQTWVTVEELTQKLEGLERPGHFRGVTTVVAKLFNAFQPDKAYFGQKDAQQSIVIQRMVKDLNLPVEIIICPTIREPDGLAMSSRNSYLDVMERSAATVLYRALMEAKKAFEVGERDADALREKMLVILAREPLARTQYVSVADCETLNELDGNIARALLSMAVHIGKTRLIDNIVVDEKESGNREQESVDEMMG
jgi:pantoate--beta-alanine ligase